MAGIMAEFEDDGGIYLVVNLTEHKMVQIETAYIYLNFCPFDARQIAAALIEAANKAEGV